MPLGDGVMYNAAHQIDGGGKCDRAETLIFMIALNGGLLAWSGRQVGSRGRDRLDAGFLVIGEHDNRTSCLGYLPQHDRRGINFQYLSLALFERRVATFQIIPYSVRLDRLAVQNLMHGTGCKF